MPPADPAARLLLCVLLAAWGWYRGKPEGVVAALVEGVVQALLAPRRNGHAKGG